MSSRKTAIASSLSLLVLGVGQAHAGTTGSVTLTSDYLFRGVSQTNEEPAVQGSIEYAADSGFYIGAWGSNVGWLSDLASAAGSASMRAPRWRPAASPRSPSSTRSSLQRRRW